MSHLSEWSLVMNLYFRLIWVWLKAHWKPAIRIGDSIDMQLTVLPNDLDVNGHMNNGRYMTIIDLALVEYMTRAGLMKPALQHGWRPMLGGSMIAFRRGLKPFCQYQLRFAVMCWDERWTYIRFEFIKDGQQMALGHTKGGIVGRNGIVSSREMCQTLGVNPESADFPPSVTAWIEADRLLRA
ncbi:thioesterase [Undibacterium sp. B2R-29]|nr:thioesterase [Undibacterium crateris]